MSLAVTINDEIKKAMLAKDQVRLQALRAVKSGILLLQTGGAGADVTDDDIITMIRKMVKQRKDSIEVYRTQNRPDLASEEEAQLACIEQFLPAGMSEDEILSVIRKTISDTGASGIKDMGKVMGAVSPQIAGRADNKVVADLIKKELGIS